MDQETTTAAPPPSYWGETRQPIYSALLILPFLLLYEVGLVFLRSDVINGGHAILLHLGGSIMRLLGMHASFASVLALIILFIVAQVRRKGSWRVRPPALVEAALGSGQRCVRYGTSAHSLRFGWHRRCGVPDG
jgi:hypothetical protein